jgi:hypothetical protein
MMRTTYKVAAAAVLAVIAGCGGGDSSEPSYAWSGLAGQCAAPRAGVDPYTGVAFPDRPGSIAIEKNWVRTFIDESYLWYDEVPPLLAADFATPIEYFDALKTPALTASGNPKDRFHFTYPTAEWDALSIDSVEIGYGIQFAFLSAVPPRDLRVAYTEPGTPATQAAISRGMKVIAIDGVDIDTEDDADIDKLNAGIYPARAGEAHSFTLRTPDGIDRTVTLSATAVTRMPVQNVRTIPTPSGLVGYLLFNDHVAPAEAQLITAINQLKGDGITDLVIDLRYNGGGYLDIASELAYMVSSPAATNGTIFEQVQFNRKNPFHYSTEQTIVPFHSTSRGFSTMPGQQLPQLGLSRVTVLTGPDTCSASEALVNGLRGVGVTVNLIGDTTCGKPYGFFAEDNCGTTYFAIQFKGVNQQGFGDYDDGFAPSCTVADDFEHALGDSNEALLAAALSVRANGVCPVPEQSKVARGRSQAEKHAPYLVRSPIRENRIFTRPRS